MDGLVLLILLLVAIFGGGWVQSLKDHEPKPNPRPKYAGKHRQFKGSRCFTTT